MFTDDTSGWIISTLSGGGSVEARPEAPHSEESRPDGARPEEPVQIPAEPAPSTDLRRYPRKSLRSAAVVTLERGILPKRFPTTVTNVSAPGAHVDVQESKLKPGDPVSIRWRVPAEWNQTGRTR